jgi:hypothetical protein
MRKKVTVFIRTEELAQITHTSIETIISLVDYGVVEPAGQTPESWEFDDVMIRVVKKAIGFSMTSTLIFPVLRSPSNCCQNSTRPDLKISS